MKDFFQTLQDAFPVLKNHSVAMARILLALLLLGLVYGAKGMRQRVCKPLLSKLCKKIFVTNRWLYVYRNSSSMDDWKYYTSEATGKGNTGDDMVWTLVTWPDLKPKDSFKLAGVVGMVEAIHESQAKLLGRWRIVHDPDRFVGPVPDRGLKSKFRRVLAKVVKFLGSI
jgi:hypothetical protein